MIFPNLVSFFKVLHLTIDSWYPLLQKVHGWKFSHNQFKGWLEHQVGDGLSHDKVYELLSKLGLRSRLFTSSASSKI